MNKKVYKCYVCGKELISRKLPHGWYIIKNSQRTQWIGYVCKDCKIGINVW